MTHAMTTLRTEDGMEHTMTANDRQRACELEGGADLRHAARASTNCSPGTSPACQADISGVAFAALTLVVATLMLVMSHATPALATDFTAPSFGQDSYAFRVNENTPTRTVVGTVAATDSDGDSLTYSVGGTDATEFNEVFALNTSTGEITVKPGASIDYESGKHSYWVDVMVTDGEDDSGVAQSPPTTDATVPVIIEIINVNETGDGMLTLSTSSPRVGVELRATVSDPDGLIGGMFRSVWAKAAKATGPFIPYESNTELTHTPTEAVQYKYLRLTVFYFDRACPYVYSISYEYGQRCLRSAEVVTDNPVQDRLGLIIQSQKVNTPATGKVLMTGRPLVGHTLYAKARHIYDPDGTQALASRQTSLRWQWYRIDPMTLAETEVASVHNFWWEYVIQTADRGKAIQVRVSFLDDTGNREVLKGALQSVPAPPNTPATNAPRVTGSPGLSEAGADGMWTAGETVQVTLTWNEAVTVDTTGGVPSIALDLGGTVFRRAAYSSGSGTTTLTFSYTLIDADGSHMSLLVPIDSLALNGGAILSQATATDAALSHNGAAKTGSTSIGTRDDSATQDEGDPFTARFGALPGSHNGSSAFTFELHFSEAPEGLSYTTVAGGLLDVTGATVGKARRLTAGSNLAWEVTMTPSQSGDITIRLPARACTETNAVCAGGSPLGEAVSATVPGVPFTASFSRVPAEHDGTAAFDIRFHLSAEPATLSFRTVQNGLFNVTGGSIEKASRLNAGRNNGWTLRIVPSGLGDVTVRVNGTSACDTAPGVCTADGRKLAGGLQVAIAGPAMLSVADAEVEEAEGATLDFVVTLSKQRYTATTVAYATSDDTATAGSDYTETSGTLTFAPLETSKTVSVPVLDDSHDEGSETLTMTLSNPSGARLGGSTATGTINNTDAMPRAWMVRFGRTVGSQVVDALSARLDGTSSSHVTVAGINVIGGSGVKPETKDDDPFGLPEWAKNAEREADAQTITADDILLRSAFYLSSGGDGAQGEGAAFTVWGRIATGGFEAEEDDVTMDGEVTTGLVGFDAEWERALAGIMLSQSTGDGAYRLDPAKGTDAGTVESSLTGVYPYARIDLNAKVSAWALAGAGSGELTLHQEGGKPMPTDISMRMGAVGVKGQVLDGSGPSGVGLNVKSDAMWVATKSERTNEMVATEGDVTRLRLILQGERVFEAGNGARFTPSAEIGLRQDGGDAETGTGIEIGAGVRYSAGPLTVEGQVRSLVAHEDSDYEEWGMSGAIRVTPSASGRGLTLSIAPAWGQTGRRIRAALVRARCTSARGGLRIRTGQPTRNRRRLRVRARARARRAHALRRDDARGCREPHGAHRHPLEARPRCSAQSRGLPAGK